ncbi:hypothetical protein [Proteus phage vB_PmiP_RS51pmB]|nr:hypothetical protein [Proteus phage vB_PmiP_RS51pmB]
MKVKYKYVNNIDFLGDPVDYLTIGNVYELEMDGDDYGTTYDNNGNEVFEFFPNPSHGKWEKVE